MVGVSQAEKSGWIAKHKLLQYHNKRGCADIKGKCGATTRNEDLVKKNWDWNLNMIKQKKWGLGKEFRRNTKRLRGGNQEKSSVSLNVANEKSPIPKVANFGCRDYSELLRVYKYIKSILSIQDTSRYQIQMLYTTYGYLWVARNSGLIIEYHFSWLNCCSQSWETLQVFIWHVPMSHNGGSNSPMWKIPRRPCKK